MKQKTLFCYLLILRLLRIFFLLFIGILLGLNYGIGRFSNARLEINYFTAKIISVVSMLVLVSLAIYILGKYNVQKFKIANKLVEQAFNRNVGRNVERFLFMAVLMISLGLLGFIIWAFHF
jgi:hypothetical protein